MLNDPGKNDNTNKGKESGIHWGCVLSAFLLIAAALAFIIPNFLRAQSVAKFSHCQENCQLISFSLEMYAGKHNGKYPPSLAMLTPDCLRTIPTCSSTRTNKGYIDSYRVSEDFSSYTFYCLGKNHSGVGTLENFPQYNSVSGER